MHDSDDKPPDVPVDALNFRQLRKEVRDLGGTAGSKTMAQLQEDLVRLRQIRDELAEEEERDGKIEVIGWTGKGPVKIPVIRIIRSDGHGDAA